MGCWPRWEEQAQMTKSKQLLDTKKTVATADRYSFRTAFLWIATIIR